MCYNNSIQKLYGVIFMSDEISEVSSDLITMMARKSLAVYIPTVHRTESGNPAYPPPHIKDRILPVLMDDSLGNTVIVAPPGSAKTATMIAACCWWIGNNPKVRIGYLSSTAKQTEKRSVAIRDTLAEDKIYQSIFPDIKPDPVKGWTKMEWFVKRDDPGNKDPTLLAAGIESPGAILGARFDRVILDDIANESNMATLNLQEQVKDTLRNTIITRSSGVAETTNMRIIMIATRWAENDPVQWAIEQGWHYVHIPAIDEEGNSYWEANWPAAKLRCPNDEHSQTGECCRYRTVGSASFTQQYQGVVVDDASSLIKSEYWQEYEGMRERGIEEFIKDRKITKAGIFVDVAHTTNKTSDFSVISVIGTDGPNFYLMDMFRKQVEFPQLVKQCEAFRQKYPLLPMFLERNSGTYPLFQKLEATIPMVNLFGLQNSNKTARVNSILPLFESENVFIPKIAPWKDVTIQECAMFPSAVHDDIVDTISMGLYILSARRRTVTAL